MRIIADIAAMLTIVAMARIIRNKEVLLLEKEKEVRKLKKANYKLWTQLDDRDS